jgi:hypothetical protein
MACRRCQRKRRRGARVWRHGRRLVWAAPGWADGPRDVLAQAERVTSLCSSTPHADVPAVPTISGMPTPGRGAPLPDLSRLGQLQAFSLTSANDTIHITAQTTFVSSLSEGLEMTVRVLPFVVSLPATTPLRPVSSTPRAKGDECFQKLTHRYMILPSIDSWSNIINLRNTGCVMYELCER